MANLHPCPACDESDFGQGLWACASCDGFGCHHDAGPAISCGACNGSGTRACPACEGAGQVDSAELAALREERDPALTAAELGFENIDRLYSDLPEVSNA